MHEVRDDPWRDGQRTALTLMWSKLQRKWTVSTWKLESNRSLSLRDVGGECSPNSGGGLAQMIDMRHAEARAQRLISSGACCRVLVAARRYIVSQRRQITPPIGSST